MNDQGSNDEKIIAVCLSDPFYSNVKSIFDLPSHILDEFKHFFEVYKTLENKITTVTEVDDVDEAKIIIRNCMNSYVEKFCK